MSALHEPKIDCHCHILDPVAFPYAADTPYRPAGQEIATAAQIAHVFAAHNVRHALLVQPNSGYGEDNRCLLAAIAGSGGRFKGIAVVPNRVDRAALLRLKSLGIVGVAFNLPFFDAAHYQGTEQLLADLVELDLYLQIQVREDQLLSLLPLLDRYPVRLLIDHCGRPTPRIGLEQPGFQALLRFGRSGRAAIKLSGYIKFSEASHPFADTWPFVDALVDAFTLDACVWGSDWPFLRARERVDYGPLVTLAETLFPNVDDRRRLFWDTPRRLFGFAGEPTSDEVHSSS